MRLVALFNTKKKRRVMHIFLENPIYKYTQKQLENEAGVDNTAELLETLEEKELLQKETDGKRTRYVLNIELPPARRILTAHKTVKGI